ncbi:hypothetical protein N1851_008055 [Merluccius polli]|uniref:Uncharacterized protein n=1 Tax=Merluccius polli TaxID=89951 RepID=A0AA47N379_MERPO|nr:hypothetical protein N1851_008055 [Merluccius polli]
MSERQAQVQQAQNEVLLELGQALTADRAVLQELLVSGDRGRGTQSGRSACGPRRGGGWGPERNTPEEIVRQVALERFIEGLPAPNVHLGPGTHRPENLQGAVNIAEGPPGPPPDGQTTTSTNPEPRGPARRPCGGLQTHPANLDRGRWRSDGRGRGCLAVADGRGHIRRGLPDDGCWPGCRRRRSPDPLPTGPGEAYRIPVEDTTGYVPGAVGFRLYAEL